MTRRIKISLIAITCFGVLCPISANAENPLDKLIPRGTLFKKLKKEIAEEFGGKKAVTPATRRTPTPAIARPDNRQRQMSTQPSASRQTQKRMTNPRSQQNKQPTLATRPLPPMNNTQPAIRQNPQPVQQRAIQPSGSDAAASFGVVVQMAKNNKMVVTRLDPQGNAIRAGLKPGDIVKSVGSVKLTSVEEYNQITKGLKPGDQMEFEIVRRGRTQKALVSYRRAPLETQVAATGNVPEIKGTLRPYDATTVSLEGVPSVLDHSMQPAARVSRLPQAAPSVVAVPGANEQRLHRTIESQRAKMQRMEQELEMLRKTNTPAIRPTENNWALPDLSSPN